MPNLNEIFDLIEKCRGWLDPEEIETLLTFYDECVSIYNEPKVWRFGDAPPKYRDLFKQLDPYAYYIPFYVAFVPEGKEPFWWIETARTPFAPERVITINTKEGKLYYGCSVRERIVPKRVVLTGGQF